MPPKRIILTRHAQAFHNVDLDYSIPDAALTPLGRKQAASLAPQVSHLHDNVDLVVTSPLKRTLQTTLLGWGPAVERLGISNVICLPQAQECNDFPCDTGSARHILENDPEFAGFKFDMLSDDWTSKQGFWAANDQALADRARWVRQWLRARPEDTIVLVAHGDVLRRITAHEDGPSTHFWRNAEARIFTFDEATLDTDDCWLDNQGVIAATGGYAPGSSEVDMSHTGNGKL